MNFVAQDNYSKVAEEAYERAVSVPAIKSARVESDGQQISIVYTQACLASGKNVDYGVSYSTLDSGGVKESSPKSLAENRHVFLKQ
jgi:hypothetical protein